MGALHPAIVGLGLLAAAVAWMLWHVRGWRGAQRAALEPAEYEFRRRQFRRRIQTSGLLAALAVALLIGPHIEDPFWATWYWIGVLALLVWLVLLALADIAATHLHFARVRDEFRAEEAALRHELRRVQSAGEDTDSGDHDPE